jgi:hypothetical protein
MGKGWRMFVNDLLFCVNRSPHILLFWNRITSQSVSIHGSPKKKGNSPQTLLSTAIHSGYSSHLCSGLLL